jgi:glycine oxidase
LIVADVTVVGGGVVGLATAWAAAERGLLVALFSTERAGAASRASAGLLVPHYSGEGAADSVGRFMTAARDQYGRYVAAVESASGLRIPFSASGAIEISASPENLAVLHARAPTDAERLLPADVRHLEPALVPCAGGVLYPKDGAVDNVRLTNALASIVERHARVRVLREAVIRLELGSRPNAIGDGHSMVQARYLVLAAGAWANTIAGLPRQVPVRPLRGQICTLHGTPLRHVVLAADVYMVSRGGDRTLVGSTMEDVGFDARTTETGIASLREGAAAACPTFAGKAAREAWSGLRPASPDLLPILGHDPEHAELLYACGHSRNGILLAPITAAAIAALAAGEDPGLDLSPFHIGRFGAGPSRANR